MKNAPHCFNKLQLENFTSVKFSIFNLHGGWFSFAACLEECHTFATDPKKLVVAVSTGACVTCVLQFS